MHTNHDAWVSYLDPPYNLHSMATELKSLFHLAVVIAVWAVASVSLGAEEDRWVAEARQLRAKHQVDLEELAAWCRQRGLAEQAKQTQDLLGRRDPYKLYLPVLPEKVGRAELPADAPADVIEWDTRAAKLGREQANELYELARRAVRGRRLSLAYQLVLAAIRANPDHEAVRRIFGYQKYRDRWRTIYEAQQLRAGKVWHEKFGWLAKAYVRRYEEGYRRNGRDWITAEEDARAHADIHHGWVVETEHYAVRTNHSLEAGVMLGEKLETLFRIWRNLFLRYHATDAQVVALFDGRSRVQRSQRFDVVFFRDRDDYNRSLRAAMPNIGMSIGVYFEQTRRAYFFAGEGYEDRTLFHEATHQLFHQSRRVAPNVGHRANFWIVEGIALFMESLRREADYHVLGGFKDERLHAARYRLLEDNFHVPLDELTTYGMQKLQADKRIATIYSQAAGVTSFLVFYEDGRYRDALVAYLNAVYDGTDKPSTLADLTGTSYPELDKQYRRFIEQSVRDDATGR
ncbi:MAG: hypothetical protein HQ567_22140 [Candidatus Nealsonbacteria bacterium]|nr:hypothetical protein [Candidatus Nealsonbacteria bacterium]